MVNILIAVQEGHNKVINFQTHFSEAGSYQEILTSMVSRLSILMEARLLILMQLIILYGQLKQSKMMIM